MKNKIGKILLSLCMVFTLCMTFVPVVAEESVKVDISNGTQTGGTSITDNFKSTNVVELNVTGTTGKITGNICISKDKTLKITGSGLAKLNIDHTDKGGIFVESGGVLEVNNVELSGAGTAIINQGKTTIGDNSKITVTDKGNNINTKNGGVTNISGSNITINAPKKSDPNYFALESDSTGQVVVKGNNYNQLVTINYYGDAKRFPVSDYVQLQEFVSLKDQTTTYQSTTERQRLDFAVNNVKDCYLMNMRDVKSSYTNELYTIPIGDIWGYTDSSGFKLDSIVNNYISKFDDLMAMVLDYSKEKNEEMTINLIDDVTTSTGYKVNSGQKIILNTSFTYPSAPKTNFKLTNTDNTNENGAAFFVQDGQLTIKGNGGVHGKRTAIYTPEGYDDSKVIIAGDYTDDKDQSLEISGGIYNAIDMKGGSLEIQRGNFTSGGVNLNLIEGVQFNITGGTYQQDITKFLTDGYTLRTNEGTPTTYTVVKPIPVAKDWWNPNGDEESGKLEIYNKGLSNSTHKNPIVWEVNGGATAEGCGNVLAKTLPTTSGETYAFSFDFTNRTSTSKAENTISVYAYPGAVMGNITDEMVKESAKLGDYYGNNNSWVHASGEFKANSDFVTFFFKPDKSSGLGSIINKESLSIEKSNAYALTDSTKDNLLVNSDFRAEEGWANFVVESGIEFGSAGTYTNAPKSPTNVAEVNSSNIGNDTVNSLTQIFETVPQTRIQVAFDFIKRKGSSSDDINRMAVYIVDANQVTTLDDLNKCNPVETVVGNVTNWQSSSFEYEVPKEQTKSMIVFKALVSSGSGIILANPSVKTLAWEPRVESITDTTLTVTAFEGAIYQLLDKDGNEIGSAQTSNVFKDLTPGTAYQVKVTYNDETKILEGVTMKLSGPSSQDTVAIKVLAIGVNGIVVETVANQEYSIDGGKTWISDEDTIVFENLKADTSYEIMTRKAETFDTMYGESLKTTVKTINVVAPVVKEKTANSITVEATKDQEYSIDDGNVWLTSTSQTLQFSGLEEYTKYTIITRVKSNDYFEASETKDVTVMTKVVVTGKAEGEDFPATVTITDKKTGKVVAVVTTDENGNWKADLDPGEYDYRVEGMNKKESFEGTFTVSDTGHVDVIEAKMEKYKPAKTSDTTLLIIPTVGLVLSVVGIWFVMRRRKANQEK